MDNVNKMVAATEQVSLVEIRRDNGKTAGRVTGRVSKRQWLNMALEVMIADGIDAVRVIDLARRLKISKSGFYWHFRDRMDLLESMKLYWVDEFSQHIISRILEQEGPLRERLLNVIRIIRTNRSGKLDLAFTSWGQRDPDVKGLVESVTAMRVEFIRKLLAETGCSGAELTARAQLFVVYFSWSEVTFTSTKDRFAGENLDEILDIITCPQVNRTRASSCTLQE
jgi:AcrR family transcriptional regulator